MKHLLEKEYLKGNTHNDELAFICEKYYLPIIQRFIMINKTTNVLDVGCGDGGALLPFAKMGCTVTGVDKSPLCIQRSSDYLERRKVSANLIAKDIFHLNDWDSSFDLIFIQDVMEYICEKKRLLEYIKYFLKPDGIVFVGFDMWQAPYGGFRSMYQNKIASKMPFVHLLPVKVFERFLRLCHEDLSTIDLLLQLRNCRVSIEDFRDLVSECDYKISLEQLFYISPYTRLLHELAPKQVLPFIKRLPHIRNYFSASCIYVLKKNNYHVQIITRLAQAKSQKSDN